MAQDDRNDKPTRPRSRSTRAAKQPDPAGESQPTAATKTGQAEAPAANVGRVVAENPIPVAMIWMGIGWLAMKAISGSRPGTGSQPTETIRETIGTAASAASGTVGTVVGAAQDVVGRVTGGAQGAVGTVTEQAPRVANQVSTKLTSGATRAQSGIGQLVESNPLLLSAGGIAGGIALGLLMPTTRAEADALAAPTKELVTRAEEVATQAIDRIEQTVAQQGNGRSAAAE